MRPLEQVYAASAPGSLSRSHKIDRAGRFQLSRRDSELYSVQIVGSGAWGRMVVFDGNGRQIFMQPSMFTGSFWLGAGAMNGIIVEVDARDAACNLTINWREPDRNLV